MHHGSPLVSRSSPHNPFLEMEVAMEVNSMVTDGVAGSARMRAWGSSGGRYDSHGGSSMVGAKQILVKELDKDDGGFVTSLCGRSDGWKGVATWFDGNGCANVDRGGVVRDPR
ncbi:PAS domain S-box protein [Sesbania bispinosa]|nr:PAS domain S-box protein [Sesbania bispinosa]